MSIICTNHDHVLNASVTTYTYADGIPSDSDDQTTLYTYAPSGQVGTITAVMPTGTPDQVTQYVYGVNFDTNSLICSNDMLLKVEYPDKTTGQAGTASSDQVSYTYDRMGRQLTKTDQNGTTHTYSYDSAGRLTLDAVTNFGTDIDQTVKSVSYSYDDLGRVESITSWANADGTGDTRSQEVFEYNGWGNVAQSWQQSGDQVDKETSPTVQYGYDSYGRLQTMTYPSGRVVEYNYDNTGRVTSITDGSTTTYAEYTYLGAGTIVQVAHPGVTDDLTLSYGSGGDYTGMDRFGRVVEQTWTIDGDVVDQYAYGYDADGNRTYRDKRYLGTPY